MDQGLLVSPEYDRTLREVAERMQLNGRYAPLPSKGTTNAVADDDDGSVLIEHPLGAGCPG